MKDIHDKEQGVAIAATQILYGLVHEHVNSDIERVSSQKIKHNKHNKLNKQNTNTQKFQKLHIHFKLIRF